MHLPQTKPYLYVDVNIGIGKDSRIKLYNDDDLEEVAHNFGIAHSLNKKEIIALYLRLENIVKKYR